jgi:hypothetical protein
VGDLTDAGRLTKGLESSKLSKREREVTGHALAHWAQHSRQWALLGELLESDDSVCRGVLGAIEVRGDVEFRALLGQYSRLPFETAAAVLRSVTASDRSELEKFISSQQLVPAMRNFVIALLNIGGGSAVRWILELIAEQTYKIEFWNVPLLVHALTKAVDDGEKAWLWALTETDEFWQYTWTQRGAQPLPVKSHENLYLFKRLVGVAIAGLCDQNDWPLLKKLVFHNYWTVQEAAGMQIAKFARVEHLNELVEQARKEARDLPDAGVVNALTLLDAKLFGQQI